MLCDFRSINLLGANFTTYTSLDLFNPHLREGDKTKAIKGVLLYGRNGTGKSTIARAFRKIAGEDVPMIVTATLCDDVGQSIALSEDERRHIFVFDEDFIDKNVKFKQDHLETIVMLGEAVNLMAKIRQAEAELQTIQVDFERQETVYNEYCDAKNPISPEFYLVRLVNTLRGDNNWAGRDREINGGRQNSNVRIDTYKRFLTVSPIKTRIDLLIEYGNKLTELRNIRNGVFIIDEAVPSLPKLYSTYDDRTIQTLLMENIEEPKLSEREKRLFALLQYGKSEELFDRLTIFRSKDTVDCPYCYQPLSSEVKLSLVASIEKVLSKAVEEHQKALSMQIFHEIDIDLSSYSKLMHYRLCLDLIENINAAIRLNNNSLNNKLNNPYKPIISELSSVGVLVAQLEKALELLENERVDFNNTAKMTAPVIEELNRLNSEITYYDIFDIVTQFNNQQAEFNIVKERYESLKANLEIKKKAVEELEAQKRNVRLAIDSINACMKYIFFAEDRLRIELINGTYRLLSRGKSVNPCDVSVGERNIIGLSYFFTSIFDGKEEREAYKEDYLLVIDDPVSSYDTENSIGILSFLKYKLSTFLESNPNTKVLLMTHDLMTFYNIQKILGEIETPYNQSKRTKFNFFELRDNSIIMFLYNSHHEYTEMIKNIYEYASNKATQHELLIGNMMRQVLEAFSTFEYKKGIEEVSTDAQILNLMPEQEYRSYYRNLMYRLVLNGGSHRKEQVKAMKDFNFFSIISRPEKIRTARDILCFIYILNKRHLLEHLKEYGNEVENTIQLWCRDIKSRSVIL